MSATCVILNVLAATLKGKKRKRKQVKQILITFCFTHFVQNIIILTFNQYEMINNFILHFFPISFQIWCFILTAHLIQTGHI